MGKVVYPNGVSLEKAESGRGMDMTGIYYVRVGPYRLEMWKDPGQFWGRQTAMFSSTTYTLDIGKDEEVFDSFNEARWWLRNVDANELLARCKRGNARVRGGFDD